jgi:hypothetical protein
MAEAVAAVQLPVGLKVVWPTLWGSSASKVNVDAHYAFRLPQQGFMQCACCLCLHPVSSRHFACIVCLDAACKRHQVLRITKCLCGVPKH